MPRSGSTIVASFFNSLDGAFIVGEPHSMVAAKRPFGHDWPAMIVTEDGIFKLFPKNDVLEQIRQYGKVSGASIYGFKEVYTINSDPIEIIKYYKHRIDVVFVLFREPRKNYASALANKPDLSLPMSPLVFMKQLETLVDLCQPTLNTKIFPISYELLIKNPTGHIYDASGWEFDQNNDFIKLKKFPGSGDAEGRGSRHIRPSNMRKPFEGDILRKADTMYGTVLARYPYMKES
jgi:hypothetical protein